jgi:transglutaminase-like putative cysteine protease
MSTRGAPSRSVFSANPALALEAAVVLVMAATAFGFLRLLDSASVLQPLLVAVLASQAIAMAGRRLRLPIPVTALVSGAVLLVVLANRAASATTSGLLPTRATATALADLAQAGMEAFTEVRAPAPPLEPFVLGAFVALWIATFVTDWWAVRLRLSFEAVVPSGALFVFCAMLGSGHLAVTSTAVYAGAVTVYAVVQRTVRQAQHTTWLAVERRRGVATVARNGVGFGLVAVAAGLLVGSHLPGAGADELWRWRGGGDGTRVVVSPFVTIESRLVDQPDIELFRVTATEPAYWRTAGLDVYHDGVWQVRGRFSRQSGSLPGQTPGSGTVSIVRQSYELTGLAEIWLPAAYAPSRIVEADGSITWNEETSTLSVDRDRAVNTGATYVIESTVARFTVEELRRAPAGVPLSVAEDFLALPGDLSPRVRDTALAVTAGQPTRFDQLRALQDWFRSEFRYDTSLGPRRGDPVEQFLDERVGFCQHFAGTFALMARALGVPARVAVGFTWGDPDPDDPTTFVVSGRHAHAWPEVWFEGLGWVAFEPTPGRGAPGAEAWTGQPAAQDGGTPGDGPAAPLDGVVPADPGFGPSFEDMLPEGFLGELGPDPPAAGGQATGTGGPAAPLPVLVVLGLAAAWFAGVPLADGVARAWRRAGARTPAEAVSVAWRRASAELEVLDLRRSDAETRLEFARRVGADRRVRHDAPIRLAELATTARYFPPAVAGEAVAEADGHQRRIGASVRRAVPAWRRYLLRVDPRRRLFWRR